MAEPATTTAVGIAAAGIGATVLSTLGLDPAQLFWAFVGSTIGVTFAAATSRLRAAVVFSCVVLVCSLAGAAVAAWLGGGPVWSKLAACLLAIVFHPFINAAITQLPAGIAAIRVKFLGGQP